MSHDPLAATDRSIGESSEHTQPQVLFEDEVKAGARFRFGENWSRFLAEVTHERVADAVDSLKAMLDVEDLAGRTFLDIGSGSGLFSLAARQLNAEVRSFDYDPDSVACTETLRKRFFDGSSQWQVERGSVLDEGFMNDLGTFDVVYSWGVLHHTGQMWRAIENAFARVAPGGLFFIALYNDQRWISQYWTMVKRLYNHSPLGRALMTATHSPYLLGGRWASRLLRGNPKIERGMSAWHDVRDWLGGFPFEVAKPEEVLDFCCKRGARLLRMKTCGGRMGCNEFVFSLPAKKDET